MLSPAKAPVSSTERGGLREGTPSHHINHGSWVAGITVEVTSPGVIVYTLGGHNVLIYMSLIGEDTFPLSSPIDYSYVI